MLEDVAARAYHGAATVEPSAADSSSFETGASVTVTHAGEVVGRGGRVAEGVVDAPVWAGAVWALEVTLPSEVTAPPRRPRIGRCPHTRPSSVTWRSSCHLASRPIRWPATIRAAGGALLEAIELFDVYRGEVGPEVALSLAFRLRFRAAERTLKDKEVDKAVQSVLRRLEEELVVKARG